MSIAIIVRYKEVGIQTYNLAVGKSSVGSSVSNDIVISHPDIDEKIGEIYRTDEGLFFEFANKNEKKKIASPIYLSKDISIITNEYDPTKDRKKTLPFFLKAILASALLLFVGFSAGYILKDINGESGYTSPQKVLFDVRSKIVEFEKTRDDTVIAEYENYGFTGSDFRKKVGFCTGFLVAPNIVLTALHCLTGGDFIEVQDKKFFIRTHDGKAHKPVNILGFDAVRDYLYIEMQGMESYGHLEWAPRYRVGQSVYTIGNAHGQGVAIREGIMASETEDVNHPGVKNIRYSAGASPGNSGGPLLDKNGRILALVFAATGAENYNLGTPFDELKKGYESFVRNRESKEIVVAPKKLLNFNPYKFLRMQMLPYLQSYDEYPDMLKKMDNLKFSLPVPVKVEEAGEVYLEIVYKESQKFIREVEKELMERGAVTFDWKSFLSDKTPAILYSQFDYSQNRFYKVNDRYVMKMMGFIDSPSQKEYKDYVELLEKEGKFDFQAYGLSSYFEKSESTNDILVYKPKLENNKKLNLEDLTQGYIYVQSQFNFSEGQNLTPEKFLSRMVSSGGMLASVYTPFIRPQSYRNFVVNDLAHVKVAKDHVRDRLDRKWKRYSSTILGVMNLYVYCLDLPEGESCIARVIPVESEIRRQLVEKNLRQEILSHFIENPYFWKPEALVKFYETDKKEGLLSLKGFQIEKKDKFLELTSKHLGFKFRLPSDIESIRLQTGLYKKSETEKLWAGYGAEWIQKRNEQDQLCGFGIELKESASSFMMNLYRDRKKRKELKDKSEVFEVPKLWSQSLKDNLGTLFGYCAPLKKNPIELNTYYADLKNAKPKEIIYESL